MLRASLAALLLMASLQVQARVNDKCIVLLEARPTTTDPQSPKTPCPIAVGFTRSTTPASSFGGGTHRIEAAAAAAAALTPSAPHSLAHA